MAPPSPAEVDRGLASYMAEAMHALHVQLQVLSDQEWLKGQGRQRRRRRRRRRPRHPLRQAGAPRRRGAGGAPGGRERIGGGAPMAVGDRCVRPVRHPRERPSRPPPKGDPRPRSPRGPVGRTVAPASVAPEGARSTRAGGRRGPRVWSPQRRPRVRVDPVLEVRPPCPLRVPLLVGGGGARGRRAAPRGVVGQASGWLRCSRRACHQARPEQKAKEGAARDPREHPGVAGGEQGPPLGPGLVGAPQREQAEQGAPQERRPGGRGGRRDRGGASRGDGERSAPGGPSLRRGGAGARISPAERRRSAS